MNCSSLVISWIISEISKRTLFKHGKSSVKLKKVKKKNALQLFYMIAVWESDRSDLLHCAFELPNRVSIS